MSFKAQQLIPRVISINFEVCPQTFAHVLIRASFRPPRKGFTDAFRAFLRDWRGCDYDDEQKTGRIPLQHLEARRQLLRTDLSNKYASSEVVITSFSPLVLNILRKTDEQRAQEQEEREQVQRNMQAYLPQQLFETLKPYQRKGVEFVAMHRGRCLIGDQMGLGKTITSIAAYRYYQGRDNKLGRSVKSLLVICPSSLRIQWAQELRRWLPGDFTRPDDQILVVLKGKDYSLKKRPSHKVVIVSYDLAARLVAELSIDRFGTAIVDESHMLKNADSKRTKKLSPLLRNTERLLLLSGTPALARPKELYPQLSLINSSIFPRFHDYGIRYCAGHELPFKVHAKYGGYSKTAWDYNGSSNLAELNMILTEHLMIRRQKEEVLSELPDKIRERVYVEVPMNKSVQKKMLQARQKVEMSAFVAEKDGEEKEVKQDKSVLEMYQAIAELKSSVACKYIEEFFEANDDPSMKLLVFAHHQSMMRALDNMCKNSLKIDYMRIDGSTSALNRAQCVDRFQNDPKCRVGLLSITAAGVGLTLTKANVAIFAELHWTPGMLAQAEARAHRLGQQRKVVVQYLIGKDTIDEDMWTMIERKIDIVSTMLDNTSKHKRTGMDAQTIDSDQKRLKPITE